MPVSLNPPALPDWERPFAAVREQAERRGWRALVVGGYVRDRLLGGEREKQIREVDILVEGQGAIDLATAVSAALNLHPPVVFERFGTARSAGGARSASRQPLGSRSIRRSKARFASNRDGSSRRRSRWSGSVTSFRNCWSRNNRSADWSCSMRPASSRASCHSSRPVRG